eukprot:5868070-Pyramimonas_sp.AAC.1
MKRSVLVFLPRMIQDFDFGEPVFRGPESTRPLSMANADATILSEGMARVLTNKIALQGTLRAPRKCSEVGAR